MRMVLFSENYATNQFSLRSKRGHNWTSARHIETLISHSGFSQMRQVLCQANLVDDKVFNDALKRIMMEIKVLEIAKRKH